MPSCASVAKSADTFDCLRKASTADLLSGVIAGIGAVTELFGYDPTIDGPGGVFADIASTLIAQKGFARIPFIAGTNLDEGMYTFIGAEAALTA